MNSWPLLPAEGAAETHTQPLGTRRRSERDDRAARRRAAGGGQDVCSPAAAAASSEEKSRLQFAEAHQRSFFGQFTVIRHLMIVLGGNERLNIQEGNTHQKKHKTHSSVGKCVPPLSQSAHRGENVGPNLKVSD